MWTSAEGTSLSSRLSNHLPSLTGETEQCAVLLEKKKPSGAVHGLSAMLRFPAIALPTKEEVKERPSPTRPFCSPVLT